MSVRHTIGIVALLAAGQSVHAEDSAPACKTWDDITAHCILAQPDAPFVRGYLGGLRDGFFMQLNVKAVDGVNTTFCRLGRGKGRAFPSTFRSALKRSLSRFGLWCAALPPLQTPFPFPCC